MLVCKVGQNLIAAGDLPDKIKIQMISEFARTTANTPKVGHNELCPCGSGIPNIYSVWKKSGWEAPIITESFSPDRIQFSLSIKKIGDKKS